MLTGLFLALSAEVSRDAIDSLLISALPMSKSQAYSLASVVTTATLKIGFVLRIVHIGTKMSASLALGEVTQIEMSLIAIVSKVGIVVGENC